MPHRVSTFLRASTDNITATVAKTANQRRDSGSRSRSARQRDTGRAFSYASSLDDDADDALSAPVARMSDVESNHSNQSGSGAHPSHKKHRLSLPFGRTSRESHEVLPAALDWKIESPPIVFYGDAENSTGALVSGQLFLNVKEERLEVDSFDAQLQIHVVQKRPFQQHCTECANQYTELKTWKFLTQPKTLNKGIHQFPFSVLLGGHLPASMDTPLMTITYEFKAEAFTTRTPGSGTPGLTTTKLDRTLEVRRSLPEPELPHHSVRVFPPTNIKASAHYAEIVHPTGRHTMSLRLDGLASTNHANSTIELWKLKKVTWKLEERLKTVAPACDRHAPTANGAPAGTPPRKGHAREETRVLGEKVMFEGWKSDYHPTAGTVDLEFEYGVRPPPSGHSSHAARPARYACDGRSRDGTDVSHVLMIEMVVSREWAPTSRPALATQTGTGRILRMHYALSLSEFAGLGVSWDNEAPPVYADVPPSPPAYPEAEAAVPDYEDLEMLEAERSSVEGRGSPARE